MKIERMFADLLVRLGRADSPEEGLHKALRRLVRLAGAAAGGIAIRPGESAAIMATAGTREGSALATWLRARLAERGRPRRAATAA